MKRTPLPPAKSTRVRTASRQMLVHSRKDEADIAVSEHLIQKETPVPLAKVLKEFGRAGTVKLDR
jgi:hypothetical protein